MPDEPPDDGARPAEPTDLRFVGPATAEVIEAAAFDAADVAAGRVSYHELVEAGVHPGVAERLRREHSLIWTFEWIVGDDMARRAAQVRGLGEAERAWLAGKENGGSDAAVAELPEVAELPSLTDREWPDVEPDPGGIDDGDVIEGVCPRCGGDLTTYALGERETVMCEACGYSGVAVEHTAGGRDAWKAAVDRLLRGERPP